MDHSKPSFSSIDFHDHFGDVSADRKVSPVNDPVGTETNIKDDTAAPRASESVPNDNHAPALSSEHTQTVMTAGNVGVDDARRSHDKGPAKKDKPGSRSKPGRKPKHPPKTEHHHGDDGDDDNDDDGAASADPSAAVTAATGTAVPERKPQRARSKTVKDSAKQQQRKSRKSANDVSVANNSSETKKRPEVNGDASNTAVNKRPSEHQEKRQHHIQDKKRSIDDVVNPPSVDAAAAPLKAGDQCESSPPRTTTPTAFSRLNTHGFMEYEFQLDTTPGRGMASDRAQYDAPIPDDFDYFSNTLFQPNQQQRMGKARLSPSLSRSDRQSQTDKGSPHPTDSPITEQRPSKRKRQSQSRKQSPSSRNSGQSYDPVRSVTTEHSGLSHSVTGNSPPSDISGQETPAVRASSFQSHKSDSNVPSASLHTPNRFRPSASQSPAISSIIDPPSPVRSSGAAPNEGDSSPKHPAPRPSTGSQPPVLHNDTEDAMDVNQDALSNDTTDNILTTNAFASEEDDSHDFDATVRNATEPQQQSQRDTAHHANRRGKTSNNASETNRNDNEKDNSSTSAQAPPPPPPLPGALGFNPASFFARNQRRKQQNTKDADTASRDPALNSTGNDQQNKEPPNIVLHIPLAGRVNQIINFKQMALDAYGFDALYPRLATARARRAQIDAASAALERNERRRGAGISQENGNDPGAVNGESLSSDEIGELITEENDDVPDDEDGDAPMADVSLTAAGTIRKRRKKIEEYSRDDPFVDDSELAWQEHAAATQDGFFVYSGPLITDDQNTRRERPETKTRRPRRSQSRGDTGTTKKRTSNVTATSTTTATTATTSAGANGGGRATAKATGESSNPRTKSRATNPEKKASRTKTPAPHASTSATSTKPQ